MKTLLIIHQPGKAPRVGYPLGDEAASLRECARADRHSAAQPWGQAQRSRNARLPADAAGREGRGGRMKAAGRIEAMLKHSRKKMLQRQNKPLEKHASETLGVGADERQEAAQAGQCALDHAARTLPSKRWLTGLGMDLET